MLYIYFSEKDLKELKSKQRSTENNGCKLEVEEMRELRPLVAKKEKSKKTNETCKEIVLSKSSFDA